MNLNVNEIFYSLQGEGGRQGEASVFVRLQGCNLNCDFCDTNFSEGNSIKLELIEKTVRKYSTKWIIWTGGEPSLQLTDDILAFFKNKGYLQAIESNGHRKLSELLDYVVVSPKGQNIAYAKKMNAAVDEIRLPIGKGMAIPAIKDLPAAKLYMLSPIFTSGKGSTRANIKYCVDYIKKHPEWRLSVQMHKLIGIA
jgi:organic radical activating enzyme